MSKILICCDFDGTLTHRVGSKTEISPFYQSLFDIQQDKFMLKPSEEVQTLFVEKFGEYTPEFNYKGIKDSDILMSSQAVTFLKELLKSEQVAINIITKNRKEYVEALLTYQGFTKEDIAKITIKDSGDKYKDVKERIKEMKPIQGLIFAYVFDDNKDDMCKMYNALYGKHFEIKTYSKSPRQFKWLEYLKEIMGKISSEECLTNEVREKIISDTGLRGDPSPSFFPTLNVTRKVELDNQEKKDLSL